MTRILAGACVRQDPIVLDYYLRSLKALELPAGVQLDFGFVDDGNHAEQLASTATIVLPGEPRPSDALYAVNNVTHEWHLATFEHLARQKQHLLDYAVQTGYDYIFLVDSDLLLEPTTLKSLYSFKAPIVNGIFWTCWQNKVTQPMPQCWLSHPYNMYGLGIQDYEFLSALSERQAIRCAGGGACTLIKTTALSNRVGYYPRLPGLPSEGMWQGEDRTFAIKASRARLRQLADGWPDIFHAYHPEQRAPEVLEEAWQILSAPRQQQAKYGDLVSIIVDPMEDPNLAAATKDEPELRCWRGRLGSEDLAPEIEASLLDMKAGEERMVKLHFTPWSSISNYRGRSKTVMLKLLDIKPYSHAPVIADVVYEGVK